VCDGSVRTFDQENETAENSTDRDITTTYITKRTALQDIPRFYKAEDELRNI